jgi:hypothetical protein
VSRDNATILFISGCPGAPSRYRCEHHIEQLATMGIEGSLLMPNDIGVLLAVPRYDLVVLHRVEFTALIAELFEVAACGAIPVVFDTDDLVFDLAAVSSIRFLNRFGKEKREQYITTVRLLRETASRCSGLLVTTVPLQTAALRCGFNALVHRNGYSSQMLAAAANALASSSLMPTQPAQPDETNGFRRETVILGYLSGSPTHDADFATIAPAIAAVLSKHPLARLRIVGPLTIPRELRQFDSRIEHVEFVAWQELPKEIGKIDINLAPLEVDNQFCQAKSEIKYIEAGLMRVVTVASPTEAFQHAIRHGETGMLALSVGEWESCLDELIVDRNKRVQLSNAAWHHVTTIYSPQVMGPHLKRAFSNWVPSLCDPRDASTELTGELRGVSTAQAGETKIAPRDSCSEGSRIAAMEMAQQLVVTRTRELQALTAKQAEQLESGRYLVPHVCSLLIRRLCSRLLTLLGISNGSES